MLSTPETDSYSREARKIMKKLRYLLGRLAILGLAGGLLVVPATPALAAFDNSSIVMKFTVQKYSAWTQVLEVAFQDGGSGPATWYTTDPNSDSGANPYSSTVTDVTHAGTVYYETYKTSSISIPGGTGTVDYWVALSGGITGLAGAEWNDAGNTNTYKNSLIAVTTWGSQLPSSLSYAFAGTQTLESIPSLPGSVIDLSGAFGNSASVPDISSWNTSAVTDMNGLFSGANAFNQDIGSWNTSSVTSMEYMFYDASSFNQDVSSWDTSSVTSMAEMFSRADVFNQSLNTTTTPSAWNTSAVTDMSNMFSGANAFNGDISGWDTSSVTTMSYMFEDAYAFDGAISSWNTASVTSMSDMFLSASVFNRDIGNWDTSKVTNISSMFSDATLFNQDIGAWNTAAVSDMSYMFSWAQAFDQDISTNSTSWDTSGVTTMVGMFNSASSFNGEIGNWDTSNVINMNSMFNNSVLFNRHIGGWDTSLVTNMQSTFKGASAFNQDIGNWDTSSVTNMSNLFKGATAFDKDVGNWNTSSVIDFRDMFNGATSFNQDISTKYVSADDDVAWDTSIAEEMERMFTDATAFNQNIGNWDVSYLSWFSRLNYMFSGASAFAQDLSSWCLDGMLPVSSAPTDFDASGPATNTGYIAPDWSQTTCTQLPPNPFGSSGGTGSAAPTEAYQGPTLGGISTRRVSSCEATAVVLTGSKLDGVSLSIQDQPLTILESGSSRILVVIPAGLEPQLHADIKVQSNFGTLTVQDAVTIYSGSCALSSAIDAKSWTKNLNNGSVKMYAKDIVGAGKIQFMVNGKEIAWVRAIDETDAKLREASGFYYLVRTVKLVPGQKNALEIYVDGERIWRSAYSY